MNHVEVMAEAASLAEGTILTTYRGDVEVQRLQTGDALIDGAGSARRIVEITRREIDLTQYREPERARPIRIAAGAFDVNAPRRDLIVSPDYRIWLGTGWVPARELINGVTIRQELLSRVTYFHLELDSQASTLVKARPRAPSWSGASDAGACSDALAALFCAASDFAERRDLTPPSLTARLRDAFALRARDLGRGGAAGAFPQRTGAPKQNFVRNPLGEGGARGFLRAGARAPLHWRIDAPPGVAVEWVGNGVEDRRAYVELRFLGMATEAWRCRIYPERELSMANRAGDELTMSCFARLARGSSRGVERFSIGIDECDGDGVVLTGQNYRQSHPDFAPLFEQRWSATQKLSLGDIVEASCFIEIQTQAEAIIDMSLRIAAPQIECGAYASDIVVAPRGERRVSPRGFRKAKASPARNVA